MKSRLLLNSILTVLLVAVIAVCANYLSHGSHLRFDLTRDGAFRLSPDAAAIVRSLDGPVQVEAFISRDLPPRFALHTQGIRDKLAEFQAASKVPFDVTFTDPGDDPEQQQRARRLGVLPRETSARSANKLQAQVTWLGLSIHHGGGEAALPFIDSTGLLEYELARALRDLQQGGRKPVLGVLVGQGEPDLPSALTAEQGGALKSIAQLLADNYELRSVELGEQAEVPGDVELLLVLGSQRELPEPAKYAIDQFVMRGGSLGLFPLPAVPNPQTRQISPRPVDWADVTGPWGATVGAELVVQRSVNGVLQLPGVVQTPRGPMRVTTQVSSPLVPVVRDLDREHPVTRRLDTVVVPFATAIAVGDPPEGVEATVLARTEADATVGASVRSLDPRTLAEPAQTETAGRYPLLVALQGPLPSAYGGRAPVGDGLQAVAGGDVGLDTAPEGTRVLLGSSFELPLSNAGLLLAAVDWLAADEQLLGIRPRLSPPAVLNPPDGFAAEVWRYGNALAWPLLILGAGLLRLRLRRR